MDSEHANERPLAELHYQGLAYVRPCGRGIILEEAEEGNGLDLMTEVEGLIASHTAGMWFDGRYVRLRVDVELLADEGHDPVSADPPDVPGERVG